MSVDIAFVILHYCTTDETLKCVDSIINHVDTRNYLIIIVDNASPNNSGEQLISKFSNAEKIVIIKNENNLGFARGNNVGFRYAKNHLARFICLMNNDTLLLCDNVYEQLCIEYNCYHFSVLGPNIFPRDNDKTVTPLAPGNYTLKAIKRRLVSMNFQLLLNYFYIDSVIKKFVKKRISDDETPKVIYNREEYCLNQVVHGCCLFFSPLFIDNYDGLNEGTFLFMEEEILYYEMMRDERTILYCPKIKIYHNEDSTINLLNQGALRRRFILRHHIQSAKVLLDVIKKDTKK